MAGRDARRRYRTAEVLEQLFALPSDDESVDGMEDSDDDTSDITATSANEASADDVSNSGKTDDDDDILYELADPNADIDWSDEDFSDTDHESRSSATDAEETEWHKDAFVGSDIDSDNITVVPQESFVDGYGPLEFFSKFFTKEVIQLLVEQTNLYAQQNKPREWEDTTNEITAFLGLLIAMGIHGLPRFRMFWSTGPLFRVQPVADIMTRQRFMKLVGNLHVNDNNKAVPRGDPAYDRLHKIRPLLTKMDANFHKQAVSSSSQSIDEAMIRFKGRSSFRQYMPMKPIKRGYKVWVRADAHTGYIYQFQIYTGKNDGDGAGLASRVVIHLTNSLKYTSTHVAFDNFFSSVKLLQELCENKIFATGTLRANRLELPILAKVKTPIKRGASKWLTRDNIGYVKWMDTRVVHAISTAFSPSEMKEAKRTQTDGTAVKIKCPKSIMEYTRRMGGVDRFDRQCALYSVSRKSKKWWLKIFYFILDAAVVNAFNLYAAVHPDQSPRLLQFRAQLFPGLVHGFCSRQRRSSLQRMSFMRFRLTGKSREKLVGVPDLSPLSSMQFTQEQ